MNSIAKDPTCPAALKGSPQWICWKSVQKEGQDKPTKVPCDPSGVPASVTDAKNYLPFEDAISSPHGVGFCFTADDPYIGIDLDHVVDLETGEICQWAKGIVDSLVGVTYMEKSPSGDGIHIIGRGKKPEGMASQTVFGDGTGIEIYDRKRFFTFTFDPISGSGDDVTGVQHTVDWLAQEPFFRLAGQKKESPILTAMRQESHAEKLKRMQSYIDGCEPRVGGERNNGVFKIAGHLYHEIGGDIGDVRTLIYTFNQTMCFPPLGEAEVDKILLSQVNGNGTPPAADLSPLAKLELDLETDPDKAQKEIEAMQDKWVARFGIDRDHPHFEDVMDLRVEEGEIQLTADDGRPWRFAVSAGEKGMEVTRHALPLIQSVSSRHAMFPKLKPVIVDGLLRETEILNVIAAPKVGKSWLAQQLAMCVATGTDFLGMACTKQKVFIVDCELHPETSVDRMQLMAAKLGFSAQQLDNQLIVDNLRGNLQSLDELEYYFEKLPDFGLIILDALYRLLPPGISENDNAAMTRVYNMLDDYAAKTGAAICCVHHTSKGDQSSKSITDIGSGAGSQSRAADCHITLLPHEMEDCVVMSGVIRSFPANFRPLTLKREFPTWIEKPMIAADVKKAEGAKAKVDTNERDEAVFQILKKVGKPSTANQLYESKGSASVGKTSISASLAELVEQGEVTVEESEVKGRKRSLYSLPPSALNHETLEGYRNEKWDIQC